MLQDLSKQQKLLADTMSEISDRCYYAGWMQKLEYVLWNAIETGPRPYGHGQKTEADIELLKSLAELSGSWIIFHNEFEETALDLTRRLAVYQAGIAVEGTLISA